PRPAQLATPARPERAGAAGPGRAAGPGAIVDRGHLQGVLAVADDQLDPSLAGVLEDVGEGLLGDPVGRQVDRGRQGPRGASTRSSTGTPAAATRATSPPSS